MHFLQGWTAILLLCTSSTCNLTDDFEPVGAYCRASSEGNPQKSYAHCGNKVATAISTVVLPKVSELETKVSEVETKVSEVEAKTGDLTTEINTIKERLDKTEAEIVEIEQNIEGEASGEESGEPTQIQTTVEINKLKTKVKGFADQLKSFKVETKSKLQELTQEIEEHRHKKNESLSELEYILGTITTGSFIFSVASLLVSLFWRGETETGKKDTEVKKEKPEAEEETIELLESPQKRYNPTAPKIRIATARVITIQKPPNQQ